MTQYLDWKVGDRVVCMKSHTATLTKGAIYTIRAMDPEWVYLDEPSTFGAWGPEWAGYCYSRFRKVHPRKTSIAIFERLLLTQGNEVETA